MSTSSAPGFAGAISTPHSLATAAGNTAFARGGNALDAALAAAAVLSAVYPNNVSIGGDLIALVRSPDGRIDCINASGPAGGEETVDRLRALHGPHLPYRGIDTITVPGAVRGWDHVHRLGAALSWPEHFGSAIDFAEHGVPVARSVAHALRSEADVLQDDAPFARQFFPGGRPLAEGDRLSQPALAETIRTIRDRGSDGFYVGAVAETLIAGLRGRGSVLSVEDLRSFAAEVTPPLSGRFRDYTVHTSQPNTHGFSLLRVLSAIEELGIDGEVLASDLGQLAKLFHHANLLRDTRLADPRFAAVDTAALLSDDLFATGGGTAAQVGYRRPAGDTVGIAASDSSGFSVSLIQSVYYAFGSAIVEEETGVLLHNRGTSFSLDEDSVNVIAALKRPAHTLMPVLLTQGRETRFVSSTMGGQGQPQIHAQVLLRAMRGDHPQDAVSAPRAIVGAQKDGDGPDTVYFEAHLDPVAARSLARTDLRLERVEAGSELLGHANLIAIDRDGAMLAGSDPRSDGTAHVQDYGERGAVLGG